MIFYKLRRAAAACFLVAGVVLSTVPRAGAVSVHAFNSGMNCYGEWKLPDASTGTTSFGTGDDSAYRPVISSPSYTNNGDGTTTDNVTGLMWVSDPGSALYTWQNALSSCAVTMNSGSGFAGYTDWRLPNIRELVSIMSYTQLPGCAIDLAAFPGSQCATGLYYWSSTTSVGTPTYAWAAYLLFGYIRDRPKTGSYNVRCVRGGPEASAASGGSVHSSANCAFPDTGQTSCYSGTAQSACPVAGYEYQDGDFSSIASTPSYTLYSGGVVVDNRTGLMWASTGSANGTAIFWTNALASCEGSTFGGYSNWRLPNVKELQSIVDYAVSTPPIDAIAFPSTQLGCYWTSTSYSSTNAQTVRFDLSGDGDIQYSAKATVSCYVRCVRGGPP